MLCSSRVVKLPSVLKVLGTVPLRQLWSSFTLSSDMMPTAEGGIVPDSRLSDKNRTFSIVLRPTELGMDPVSALSDTASTCSIVSCVPIDSGIVPVRAL